LIQGFKLIKADGSPEVGNGNPPCSQGDGPAYPGASQTVFDINEL
jgi:hypothetical protein